MPDQNKTNLPALANFAYACAMLKNTPRSGYAFLGSGSETVAEHSFGAAMLGLILAQMAQADMFKTILLILFHDLHEASTGDLNYVNQRYDNCAAQKAVEDICQGTDIDGATLFAEFEAKETLEARLANDADQLDFICSLRKQETAGNPVAGEWLRSAVQRLKTEQGRELCAQIMQTSPNEWWYGQADMSWWINRRKT